MKMVFQWPAMPPLPPSGQPVLIRVRTSLSRTLAKQELRAGLHQVLASWSRQEPMPLHESPHGPVWVGRLADMSLDISLSYADGESWIGLLRGGSIGIDVMRVQAIPEAENLARLYLGSEASQSIHEPQNPDLAFALAWTKMEARLKCLKRPLQECSEDIDSRLDVGRDPESAEPNDLIVAFCAGDAGKSQMTMECLRLSAAGDLEN